MNDLNSVDLSPEAAWSRFRTLLADHLDGMPAGHSLVLACPHADSDPVPPCLQFYGWDDETVRCEVLADEYLAEHRRWTSEGRALLEQFGFAPPPSLPHTARRDDEPVNWFVDRPRRYADQLADAAVRVLRSVWGVPHPSFLELDGDLCGPVIEDRFGASSTDPEDAPPSDPVPFDPLRPVRTSGPEARLEIIEQTLLHILGFVPHPDEDGDYPFRLGPAWLYLCPTPEAPFVQILAPLAAGVTDEARALSVVNDVNRRWPHVKVLLDEDRIVATIDVTVVPFVPQHVADMLAVMEKFAGEAAEHLRAGLGARPYLDAFGEPTPECDAGDGTDEHGGPVIPEALRAIAEAVWERGADIDVEEVLNACGHDRTRVVRFLDVARECELSALDRTLDDTDPRVAASAGLDARVWRTTSALLTSAHRRLAADRVDGPTRSSGSQLDLFGTDLAGGTGDSLFD
ncbi:T3SS (YopN, CesT) and YbjN peptide-binding chaperone 1 [Rhodococcus sp. NBC_00297]|uniref:T3SS (YopN, CesT) and YbjN peptide-binding chaperone 1 n=1 Tax=Rhodococcus sp. NBC_00297 TaxID=2976005 RepID=UPI002E2B9770|nr:hypothetical protein [Rhodococcus sp. NBC_00297]